MEAGTAKKLIEKNLPYEEVKRLLVRLVQTPSPQTDMLETEPQVLGLMREVINPELEPSGLHRVIDEKGNLVGALKGRGNASRLMLVGYGMNAAPRTTQEPDRKSTR